MKNILFKRKTIPIEVNFLLWKKITFDLASLNFFSKFSSKKLDDGGGVSSGRKILFANAPPLRIYCLPLPEKSFRTFSVKIDG